MSYCNPGDKVRVTYQFKDGQSTTYECNVPIDVITDKANPYGDDNNYNPQGYQITFNSPQGAYGQIQFVVVDYHLYTLNGTNFINWTFCNGTPSDAVITSPVVIDNSAHCAVIATNDRCEIKILNNANILFSAQGNCPVTFNVACGDDCPNGYCKIDCDVYPGYCCINEAEIQGWINELK